MVASAWTEDQVYRIDHYLGKETVQNILVFRWANGIFEPLWNRNHVDHVQITVGESIGIESRGAYYEESGALRDMIQNHILQLLCLVAMEPPVTFDADPVRDEKSKVIRAIRPIPAEDVDRFAVRAQYGPGFVAGRRVAGYREERGVSPQSITETYAALELTVDNWRWAGVPFYLRTGKRLPKRASEIACSSSARRTSSSGAIRRTSPSPTSWSSGSSPTRACRCRSARSCPGRSCASSPWRWTSTTAGPSAARLPRPTSACSSTP